MAAEPKTKKAPRRPTETWLHGEPGGKSSIAWVMKRTYRIQNGRCELDDDKRQEVLSGGETSWDPKRGIPRLAPPMCVSDLFPFRPKTDVVIQGFAHAYDNQTRRLSAQVRFGDHAREIVVYGDRFGDFDRFGRPLISDPGLIEVVPVRYDYAFGGVDLVALARYGDPVVEFIERQRPEMQGMGDTRYHYPRNPTGLGYLMELSESRFTGLPIPHLEFPFDPLTPERLAVGTPKGWLQAPLPAGWDYQSQGWFPRIGLIGLGPPVIETEKAPPEVVRGWAPPDLLRIPPLQEEPDAPIRLEHGQVASPGMSVKELAPDETFELENLHPNKPLYTFRMPGEVPTVKLAIGAGEALELVSHLSSVVVRPFPGEIVVVWSARAPAPGHIPLEKLMKAPPDVVWTRKKERGA